MKMEVAQAFLVVEMLQHVTPNMKVSLTKSSRGSPMWNVVMHASNVLQDGFAMHLGGVNLDFWKNAWMLKLPLAS
ncbi:hypothetical protein VNO78_08631 [Psophocarpus tetragonolobus]|uniref:Uncharacterized protein n=1 Tax=Psophocarpus tetragonolobus TaxID=3891 RepID=A0AAN9SVB2_PSOTE